MYRNYLLTAIRNIRRNKAYAAINIGGLSVGLACAMLILLYSKDEVSYDRFHANAGNIYRIVTQTISPGGSKGRRDGSTGILQGPMLAAPIPTVKAFVRMHGGHADIKSGADVASQEVLYVDSSFFSIFTFPLLAGNSSTCLQQPNSIVLSEDEAKKEFGKEDPIGKTLLLKENGKFQPYSVTAVAKNCPQNSSIKFDILVPFKAPTQLAPDGLDWFNFFLNTFILVAPNADVHAIESQMKREYDADAKEAIRSISAKFGAPGDFQYLLQPLTDIHLSKDLSAQNGLSDASNSTYSYILSAIAFFILLIACINFVNLTIALSIRRSKEIGIRKTLGGVRKQLVAQFLSESFLLCFISFLLAIGLVILVLPLFDDLSNKALSISYLLDLDLIALYIALFLFTGFLAGFYPAFVLSGYDPIKIFYRRFQIAGKDYLQKGLVVLQFTLASFLIIATLIIYSQFVFLTSENPGYDGSNLVLLNKPDMNRLEAKMLKEELMRSPDVVAVSPKSGCCAITAAKVNGDSVIGFDYETIDESYLPLMRIPIVRGRNFSASNPSDSNRSVLVNEAFVRKAGWKDPIGKEVNFWYKNNEKYYVIGVVKDYHFEALTKEISPQLFTMNAGNNYGMACVKIKANNETRVLDHIRKTFKDLYPLTPYTYIFQDDANRRNYQAEQKWKRIVLFGAILTIIISCVGLFGLSVLSTEKRTKEIGIRKVLGASVSGIVTILAKQFLKLVIIALLISIPLAWLLGNKWLQNYPYRTSLGWLLFAIGGSSVLLLAIATISFQIVMAAIANPTRSLRTES